MRGKLLVVFASIAASASASLPSQTDRFISNSMIAPSSAKEVDDRCDAAVALAKRLTGELASARSPASVASIFRPYDELTALLADVGNEQYLISQTNTDAAIRAIAERCVARTGDAGTDVQLSRPIYERLNALPRTGLDANTGHLLDHVLLEFRLAGVDRDAATRARIAHLQKQITAAGLTFSGNIRDARGESFFKPEELAGMPADFMADHRPGADGRIWITTDYPDALPVLAFADNEDTRHAVYLKLTQRAWPTNEPVLRQLFILRAELAKLLGRRNAAEVALADKMTCSARAFDRGALRSGTRASPPGSFLMATG